VTVFEDSYCSVTFLHTSDIFSPYVTADIQICWFTPAHFYLVIGRIFQMPKQSHHKNNDCYM